MFCIFRLFFRFPIYSPGVSSSLFQAMGLFFLLLLAVPDFLFPIDFDVCYCFSSKVILLLFLSLYSVCSGLIGMIWLNICSDIRVTADPLSLTNLIGRLSINAAEVKNGCPSLDICLAERTVLVIKRVLFRDQSSSLALVGSDSG